MDGVDWDLWVHGINALVLAVQVLGVQVPKGPLESCAGSDVGGWYGGWLPTSQLRPIAE